MAYDIIIGRSVADRKSFGDDGTIFIGKSYVKMGRTTSLSNNVFLDVNRSHVILVSGKRGSGKSYSLAGIAEGISNLPPKYAQNISVLLFDTMGIFWTMKYKNEKDESLLKEWGLEGKGLNVQVYAPKGKFKELKNQGIPVDFPFAIAPNELTGEDWQLTFGLTMTNPIAILIEKVLYDFTEQKILEYGIPDIIKAIEKVDMDKDIKISAINQFRATQGWGLFDKKATPLKEIVQAGKVSVLDVSVYTYSEGGWGVKNLVIGLVSKKLFIERMIARKKEELKIIQEGYSYFKRKQESNEKDEFPLVWLVLDEAHEALPNEGQTPATEALVTILREGRQPGISLILATQQPGKIHSDVMTQSDIVLSHRITAKPDIEALNTMMQSYLLADLTTQLNNLPREKGAAIILDDNSERLYPMKIRPRFTWHGGEAPTVIKKEKTIEIELGLE